MEAVPVVAAPHNVATFVLQDDLGPQPLDKLFQATRMAVESFYEAGGGEEGGSGDAGDPSKKVRGSSTLRAQLLTSRAAAAKPANTALDLSSKTNRELVALLRHRDEGMKLAAASVLEKKVCGVLATDVARVSAVEELTKNGLRPLVEILTATASSTQLLYKTVVILIAIFNGTCAVGGLGPLLSHVSSEDSALVKQLLVLITDLALNEQNQDGFRRTGLLDKVVPTLAHPDPEVRLSAAEALVNLSVSAKNQETIAKANALPLVIQALRTDDDHFQLQSMRLLHNLSQCAMAKANFTSEDLALLLTFADAEKLGQEPKERNLTVQRYTLATLAGLASFEKHQHKIGELGAVKLLLPFLELAEGPVPVDGDVLSSVLETFDHLLNLKDNQYMFFQANGQERVLAILRKPQAFSEPVVIEAASIVAHLSSSSNSHVFGSIGVRQLNNLLDMYPQNTTMHLLVAKTYASLSQDGHSARLLVANQAELVLAKFILESRTKQVLEHACLALSKLAGFDSVRAYIIQSELVKKLISLLGYSDQSLVGPVTTTIGLVAVKEEGMAAIMEYGGLLPLITLLQSQDTRIQEMALTAIGRVVLADQSSTNRQDLVYRGGLKEMIGLMTSSSPAVQLLVLGILKALAKYEDMREPFQTGGLMEKIRLLADHPNVQKENSNVRQTLRMLLLAVKTLLDAPPTPVSVPSSPMLSAVNYTPEEMQKLDTVLASLTRDQLISLVKEAVTQGANVSNSIKQFVHINIAAGNQSERAREIPSAVPAYESPSLSSSGGPPPPPPTLASSSSPGGPPPPPPPGPPPPGAPASPSTSRGAPPPPPPQGMSADGPSLSALQLGKSRLRAAGDRAERGPIQQAGKEPPKMSVVDELNRRNKDPAYRTLKHVDLDSELELRRQEKHQRSSRRLLKDIEAGKKRQFLLLSEGTEEGKKYWKKDPEWYVEEIQKALCLDTQMVRVIFSILETDSASTPFEVTHNALNRKSSVPAEDLAQALLKVGFTLKSRQVVFKANKEGEVDSEPVKEYTHIILPGDMPVKYILKTILATVQPSVAAPGRAMSNVDADGSESPLPPMPSSPLPSVAIAPVTATSSLASSRSAVASQDHRSSPTMLAVGSLSSSRSGVTPLSPRTQGGPSSASPSPLSTHGSSSTIPSSSRGAQSSSATMLAVGNLSSSRSGATPISPRTQGVPPLASPSSLSTSGSFSNTVPVSPRGGQSSSPTTLAAGSLSSSRSCVTPISPRPQGSPSSASASLSTSGSFSNTVPSSPRGGQSTSPTTLAAGSLSSSRSAATPISPRPQGGPASSSSLSTSGSFSNTVPVSPRGGQSTSPTTLAVGSLSSSRSAATPISPRTQGGPPSAAPSSLSTSGSWTSTVPSSPRGGQASFAGLSIRSQPLPVTRSVEPFVAEQYTPGALSSEFAALLQGLDDVVANSSSPQLTNSVRETCGLCKQSFPAAQTKRIANKSFCGPCHDRVTALAKQRAVHLG